MVVVALSVIFKKLKKHILVHFLFWNGALRLGSSASSSERKFESTEINLPGEPLNPKDFQNAKTFFVEEESGTSKVFPECEILRNDFHEIQKSKDQPTFSTWENGYVPYMVDFQFGLTERATIAAAIARLRQLTCINFITKLFHKDYVFIVKKSNACGSFVGRMGGEQMMILNDDCMTQGSVLHELLHVIGFEHEQCRMDRDEHIRVSFYNLTEDGKHNFFKIPPPRANYAGPYDITSITHYGAFAFGRKGLQTIFPNENEKNKEGQMGQREKLSEIDKLKINNFYNCSNPVPQLSYHLENFQIDLHPNCKEFARLGACSSATWMRFTCRKSCPNAAACSDFNGNCGQWARDGECTHPDNRDYMSLYCSKSCDLCSKTDLS